MGFEFKKPDLWEKNIMCVYIDISINLDINEFFNLKIVMILNFNESNLNFCLLNAYV